MSDKEVRTAKAKRNKPVATIEQLKHTLGVMPANTDIQKRDRALVAFTLLSGARDSAIASLKLKHIDFNADTIYQDAREVKTKFSKTFTTCFFPVGDDVRQIVYEWVQYLKAEHLFGNNDPLFPKTKMSQGSDNNFKSTGLSREHWSSAAAIRKVFKEAFLLAGLPSFNPHSFRNTLANLGETLCQTPEEFKAWSQNLGHEGVLTTFYSYGDVQEGRQADIFKQLKEPRTRGGVIAPDVAEFAKALAKEMNLQKTG